MSTATLDRPPARPAGSNFSGTLSILRLYLRRDRITLPLWVLLLSVPLATVYVGSIEKVYPTAGRALRVRRVDYGQSGPARAVRPGLQRQRWGRGHLESRDVPPADRGRGHSDRHPPHPRRRGIRPDRTDRLDRHRPLRQPDRGADAVLRCVDRHRCDRRGGIARHRHSRRRLARLRGGAGRIRSGVHRCRRGRRAAVAERPSRARFRIRRVGDRVHAARRRRRRLRRAVVALAAGVVAASPAVRG